MTEEKKTRRAAWERAVDAVGRMAVDDVETFAECLHARWPMLAKMLHYELGEMPDLTQSQLWREAKAEETKPSADDFAETT